MYETGEHVDRIAIDKWPPGKHTPTTESHPHVCTEEDLEQTVGLVRLQRGERMHEAEPSRKMRTLNLLCRVFDACETNVKIGTNNGGAHIRCS